MLKLVELRPGHQITASQISLASNSTIINIKPNPYNTDTLKSYCQQQPKQSYYPRDGEVSNLRSLSEPRHQSQQKLQNQIQLKQSNFSQAPNQGPQEFYLTNQDLISHNNQPIETYDNLNDTPSSHQSRIVSKQELNHFDRYNRTMRPMFSSVRVPNSAQRDIRSVDRDPIYGVSYNPRKVPQNLQSGLNSNNARDIKSCDRELSSNCRSGSLTPCRIQSNAAEEDELTLQSRSCSLSNGKHRADTYEYDEDERTLNDNNETENLLDSLDEKDIENFETSKIKMKLMQRQLETLTSLVHQALMNRDLGQLAIGMGHLSGVGVKANGICVKESDLVMFSEKAKFLKNDLSMIKKMQENFTMSVGDSMKGFVRQLNVSL